VSVPQEDQSSTANLELHQVNDSDSNSICLETAIWEPYIFSNCEDTADQDDDA